jgi:hypothetical protein
VPDDGRLSPVGVPANVPLTVRGKSPGDALGEIVTEHVYNVDPSGIGFVLSTA